MSAWGPIASYRLFWYFAFFSGLRENLAVDDDVFHSNNRIARAACKVRSFP
jgi:hypothetical protein